MMECIVAIIWMAEFAGNYLTGSNAPPSDDFDDVAGKLAHDIVEFVDQIRLLW